VRRLIAGSLAFLAVTAGLLVLPVYAAPTPAAHPVSASVDEVALGSVVEPRGDAVVTTDGEVQPGGVDESVATGTPPASTAPSSQAPETTASSSQAPETTGSSATPGVGEQDVVTSGDELAGVPALTVSQPDTDRFSSVGITWRDDPAVTDVVVQLRVLAVDGTWGEWTTLQPDDAEPTGSAKTPHEDVRAGTAPYWTGEAHGIEAIVQGAGGAVPEDVRVALIDPGSSEADRLASATPTGTAHAAQAMPRIYTRGEWGADEGIRTWAPEYVSTIKAATLHHTADGNNYTADQVPAILRSMYAYHAQTRGWGDIGYNVIVDKFGRIFEGRYGGLTSTVVGAHAGGFNSYTFGVSMLGNYDIVPVPQATVDAVGDVIAWKFSLYGVDPRGTTVLTSGGGGTAKYAAGTRVTLPTVFGHRDVGATACPGVYGYARLGQIRDRVAALVNLSTSAIERRYNTDAALRENLGAAVGSEQYGNGFAWQQYATGRLYWSPTTGVHLLRGDILAAFLAAGGPAVLGAPATDEGAAGYWGAYNHFANDASIYWTVDTGAQIVRGGIRERWLAVGAEWTMGFPTGPETAVGPGAVRSRFTSGDIYWSAATGAHSLRGGIRAAWEARGGVAGMGLPVTEELPVAGGGARSDFSSGASLVWGPQTGAYIVYPGILDAWTRSGAGVGPLGFPTADEADTGAAGGRYVRFESGNVYWSPPTGAQPLWGSIDAHLVELGGVRAVGYPLHQPVPAGPAGSLYVQFTGVSSMYASPATGAHLVLGGIRDRWRALGAEWGRLGLPTSDERSAPGGARMSEFQGGVVYWGPATGAHAVVGGIGETYASLGGPASTLGLPVTDEYAAGATVRQDFTGGALVWSAASNAVVRASR
jgi:uncharacterized protein with LGFP repeats